MADRHFVVRRVNGRLSFSIDEDSVRPPGKEDTSVVHRRKVGPEAEVGKLRTDYLHAIAAGLAP